MAKRKSSDPYPTDTHMLNFIGKYVTEITEVETRKKGVTLVQVEYWPKTDQSMMLAERKGKDRIQAFRDCVKEAIRITDSIFNNRDWDVLGTPKKDRNKSAKNRSD